MTSKTRNAWQSSVFSPAILAVSSPSERS